MSPPSRCLCPWGVQLLAACPPKCVSDEAGFKFIQLSSCQACQATTEEQERSWGFAVAAQTQQVVVAHHRERPCQLSRGQKAPTSEGTVYLQMHFFSLTSPFEKVVTIETYDSLP